MRVLTEKQSGTAGQIVSVPTRYGQTRRRRPIPSKRRTNAQINARSRFGSVSALESAGIRRTL